MTQPIDDDDHNVRPEYQPQIGETQEDALRYELLILIDYARDAGITDDIIDAVLQEVVEERAAQRRRAFKLHDNTEEGESEES